MFKRNLLLFGLWWMARWSQAAEALMNTMYGTMWYMRVSSAQQRTSLIFAITKQQNAQIIIKARAKRLRERGKYGSGSETSQK